MNVSLSQTSKMPSKSIGLSAWLCITGSKLAQIPSTVCHKCYARRGFFNMPSVKTAMESRLEFMLSEQFVPRMIAVLGMEDLFRWFDSGDIQSEKMGHDILDIIEATPWCKHWLPSKEYTMWRNILKERKLPPNVKEETGSYNCGSCRACWDTSVSNIAYPKRYESKRK
mgnify:CR=1 FL=1